MNKNMEKETIEIIGRKYKLLTMAEAEHLEFLRQDCFIGRIDANTCETECYSHIFHSLETKEQNEISGVVRGFRHCGHYGDIGVIWVANHSKKTLTYDGIRSMKVAMDMKQIGNPEYPTLISREEYLNFIKYYSKFFGTFAYKEPGAEVSKEEVEVARKIVLDYNTQEILKRRARKPKFGDFVRTLCGEPGRYIGQNQAIFIKELVLGDKSELSRDIVDMDDSWIKSDDEFLPTDADLINFIRDNNWNTKE